MCAPGDQRKSKGSQIQQRMSPQSVQLPPVRRRGKMRRVACQMLAGSLAADQGAIRDDDLTAYQCGHRPAGDTKTLIGGVIGAVMQDVLAECHVALPSIGSSGWSPQWGVAAFRSSACRQLVGPSPRMAKVVAFSLVM